MCVLLVPPKTKFLVDAAFLTIEILSEDDKMTKVMEKLEEYEAKGVPNIWLIDPRLRKMSVYSGGDLHEVRDDVIITAALAGRAPLELTWEEIFHEYACLLAYFPTMCSTSWLFSLQMYS